MRSYRKYEAEAIHIRNWLVWRDDRFGFRESLKESCRNDYYYCVMKSETHRRASRTDKWSSSNCSAWRCRWWLGGSPARRLWQSPWNQTTASVPATLTIENWFINLECKNMSKIFQMLTVDHQERLFFDCVSDCGSLNYFKFKLKKLPKSKVFL